FEESRSLNAPSEHLRDEPVDVDWLAERIAELVAVDVQEDFELVDRSLRRGVVVLERERQNLWRNFERPTNRVNDGRLEVAELLVCALRSVSVELFAGAQLFNDPARVSLKQAPTNDRA